MLPDHDVGVFASFNTVSADYDQFLQAFVDWLFPVEPRLAREEAETALGRFTGPFRPTRYPHRTMARLAALLSTFEIREDEGALVTDFLQRTRWIPVIAFERAPGTETPQFVSATLGGGLLVALLVVFFWPVAFLVRWHYGVKLERERRVSASARWTLWAASLVLVVFSVGLAMLLEEPMDVVFGLPSSVEALFWLPALAALLAALALLGSLRARRSGRGTLLGRLGFTLACAALLVVVCQLSVWNIAWPTSGG